VAIDGTYPVVFRVSAATGVLTSSFTFAFNGEIGWKINPDALLLDDDGNTFIVMALKEPLSPENRVSTTSFNLEGAVASINWGWKTSNKPGHMAALRRTPDDTSILVAGVYEPARETTLHLSIISIAKGTGKEEWGYGVQQPTEAIETGYEFFSQLEILPPIAADYHVFAVSVGTFPSVTTRPVSFVKIHIEGTPTAAETLQLSWTGKVLTCNGI